MTLGIVNYLNGSLILAQRHYFVQAPAGTLWVRKLVICFCTARA
jgi:hypothetical protein